MSDNLNRSKPYFSKYNSMSIGELEEILRADAMGSERDDSDVDEILYVMEVLAKKRRQNGIAGKTALEAYQEFQQHYLPMVEEDSKPQRQTNIIPFRRIAAVAASLVLVFSLSITANAFSFKDVWDAVVTWAQETFSFSMGVEVSEPKTEDEFVYSSFQNALIMGKVDTAIVPSRVPDGYFLIDIKIDETPIQKTYMAIFQNDDKYLKLVIQSLINGNPEQIEISGELVEKYSTNGIDFYFLENNDIFQVAWFTSNYECYIAGDASIDELKYMIDSVGKDE